MQIIENTPENHPDHSHLKHALEKAEELCSQVNEGVREKENSDRLEWIQAHVQCEGLSEVTGAPSGPATARSWHRSTGHTGTRQPHHSRPCSHPSSAPFPPARRPGCCSCSCPLGVSPAWLPGSRPVPGSMLQFSTTTSPFPSSLWYSGYGTAVSHPKSVPDHFGML